MIQIDRYIIHHMRVHGDISSGHLRARNRILQIQDSYENIMENL